MSGFHRNSSPNRSPAGGYNRSGAGDSNQIPAGDSNRSPANVSHPKPDLKHPYPPELLNNVNPDNVKAPYALTHELRDKVCAVLEKQGKELRESGKHVQEIIQALLRNDMDPDKTAAFLAEFEEPKESKAMGGR